MTAFHEPDTVRYPSPGTMTVERPPSPRAATPTDPLRTVSGWAPARSVPIQAPAVEGGRSVTALLAVIGAVRARELAELRWEFNRPSRGGWGIVFDPGRACWIGVLGRRVTVYGRSAQELRERILSGVWKTLPLAA